MFIRKWLADRRGRAISTVCAVAIPDYYMPPTAPNPTLKTRLFDRMENEIGKASFGQSPVEEVVYLYSIEIGIEHRRKGFGTAFLLALHHEFGIPIIPVHEVGSSLGFWGKARRRLNGTVIRIGVGIGASDLPSPTRNYAEGTRRDCFIWSLPDESRSFWF